MGSWVLVGAARVIAAGYFFFSPLRRESIRFYQLLFPEKSPWFCRACTFRQYQRFTTIHADRFLAHTKKNIGFEALGWEQITPYLRTKGALLLMSHLGNWEIAAILLRKQDENLPLLLYMGLKEKEGVEAAQKMELTQSGVRIIAAANNDNDPFSMVEGIRFLREGGVVSMPGDIVWHATQRKIVVSFLGKRAFLPAAPFVLARLAESPLFVFFAFQERSAHYTLSLSEPIFVHQHTGLTRDKALAAAAQQYADILAETVRSHPFDWFHFSRFVVDLPAE